MKKSFNNKKKTDFTVQPYYLKTMVNTSGLHNLIISVICKILVVYITQYINFRYV
eukprot:UN00568